MADIYRVLGWKDERKAMDGVFQGDWPEAQAEAKRLLADEGFSRIEFVDWHDRTIATLP